MEALKIEQLYKVYGIGTKALSGVDLTIEAGDFFALLGANGAGKTTLINIVVGLVNKSSGSVKVFGIDNVQNPNEAKAKIGIVPQEFNFNMFENVQDIVISQGGYYGMSFAEARKNSETILKNLDLWEKRDTQAMKLSGGMKRRLMIARALIHNPKLLILDEPTAGVDVELRRGMWDYLRRLNAEGTTILLTTHYLEEVEQLCKNMAIIKSGLIVKSGSVQKLLSENDKRRYRLTISQKPNQNLMSQLNLELIDDTNIFANLDKDQTITDLCAKLNQSGIKVLDIKHAGNQLEELYLATIGK